MIIILEHFSGVVLKNGAFLKIFDCQTCVVDWPTVLQGCYGCYSNYAGGSQTIPNI